MGESAKRRERKLHLKLPSVMLETALRPTGFRNSPEAEASWRLAAAAVAVRVLKPKGILPISREASETGKAQTKEMHIPLSSEDFDLLDQVAREEGGTRGELVRQLLMMTQRVIEEQAGQLNHDGLVAAILERFSSPMLDPILAEW